jgi:hypothetical protein
MCGDFMGKSIDFVKKAGIVSNEYELCNTDLKKQYIVSNIILYNTLMDMLKSSSGTFGTGYPFYVFDKGFNGALPIIDEQIRYNNELITNAENSGLSEWRCAECLNDKYHSMPDLKQICRACPSIVDSLKPRELIKRLPDIDMWMVCNDDDIMRVADNVSSLLYASGFKTSDIDPVSTIYDLQEIVASLKAGDTPQKKLPIDTHIIDYATLYTLICQIPDTIDYCSKHDIVPYLPIHPLSLRKTWQKDDMAYNFVHDYLYSFTEFNFDPKLQGVLDETRKYIAEKYSFDKLYDFMLKTGSKFVEKRQQAPGLRDVFDRRIQSWRGDVEPIEKI